MKKTAITVSDTVDDNGHHFHTATKLELQDDGSIKTIGISKPIRVLPLKFDFQSIPPHTTS